LLLVGLDKAGKTSCLEKLRALQLAPLDSSAAVSAAAAVQLPVAPTVGLNIARFELSGCKLTLWDLGGQVSTHARAAPVSPGAGHSLLALLRVSRLACVASGRNTTQTHMP
jgi:GTPase SAR1 family protein